MSFQFQVPEGDIDSLDRTAIRALARQVGQCRLLSTRAFMGLIPAIARFRIFLDEGCADLYEYCAKVAGMSRDEVNRALALHGRIGRHACLWRLLAGGDVGLSKLERIAPFVTEANADWIARQVQALPKAQLEELLRQIGSRRARPRGIPGAEIPPSAVSTDRSAVPSGAGVTLDGPSSGPVPSSPLAVGMASAALMIAPAAEGRSGPGTGSADDEVVWQHEPALAEMPAEIAAEMPSRARSVDPDVSDLDGEAGLAADPVAVLPRIRLMLEVDPLGDKRIRELQRTYERLQGRPIGLGELFALLATEAITRGVLPVSGPLADADQIQGDVAAADPVSRSETGSLDTGNIPIPASARNQAADPHRRVFRARIFEVVVSIAETGWRFARTAAGWLPVRDSALCGFLSHGQPVPLGNLRIAAIAAAQGAGASSRHVPAAVERYLLARSGGYCESGDCRHPVAELHHRRRFALDPSHHPDDLIAVCTLHHGVAHHGLLANEQADPAVWVMLDAGEEAPLNVVDLKVQQHRRAPAPGRPAPSSA